MDAKPLEQSSSAPIYEALKAAIMSGDYAPGEPLRQDEIARQHGVSKIPVREALLRLEVDGFVQFRKNKGASVRSLSRSEVLNLMDIRVALECKALELAVPHMVASDFELVESILAEYGKETSPASWSVLNTRFHRALYEPCANLFLIQMIEDLWARMGPFVRLLVSETSGLSRPHEDHKAILAACRAGDVDAAVSLMQKHIETTKKEMAARLRPR